MGHQVRHRNSLRRTARPDGASSAEIAVTSSSSTPANRSQLSAAGDRSSFDVGAAKDGGVVAEVGDVVSPPHDAMTSARPMTPAPSRRPHYGLPSGEMAFPEARNSDTHVFPPRRDRGDPRLSRNLGRDGPVSHGSSDGSAPRLQAAQPSPIEERHCGPRHCLSRSSLRVEASCLMPLSSFPRKTRCINFKGPFGCTSPVRVSLDPLSEGSTRIRPS